MHVILYTDGGARGNPGPAAIGVVVCNSGHEVIFKHRDTIGFATNNVAEYCALIAGLEIAAKLKAKKVDCYMDSELLMNQMSGKYRVKTEHIRLLYNQAKESASRFEEIHYHHKPREFPMLRQADKLVNEALDEAAFGGD